MGTETRLENYPFPDPENDSLDQIAIDLQHLRDDAGTVSFGEIAVRIAKHREAQGVNPAAARVARSSVHAMFATGRRRINPDLVQEIVRALGEDEASAAAWRTRCIEVQREYKRPSSNQLDLPPPVSTSTIPQPFLEMPRPTVAISPLIIVLTTLACIGLNYFGSTVNEKFSLPLFLDMVGTATAAFALGPWYGALVGLLSNLLLAIGANPASIPFALVNMAGALLWGYGVRAWRMRHPWWKFFLLNILVAVTCTIIAVPLNVMLFGGFASGHVAVDLVAMVVAQGEGLWQSVFTVNMAMSVADKLLAGYVGLGIVLLLKQWRTAQVFTPR